jgi:hypothetical protein
MKPSVIGVAEYNQQLASTDGMWSGNPVITYTYQWLADGEPVLGATFSTFYPRLSDVGKRISIEVTATNSVGTASSVSLETATVYNPYLVNTGAESVMAEYVDGIAFDWSDDSCMIKNQAVPANNYLGLASTKLPVVRASTATTLNRYGLIETVGNNVHRPWFDPATGRRTGFVFESQSTNRQVYSEDPSQSPWFVSPASTLTVVDTNVIDPMGNAAFSKGIRKATQTGEGRLSCSRAYTIGTKTCASFFIQGLRNRPQYDAIIHINGNAFANATARYVKFQWSNGPDAPPVMTVSDTGGGGIYAYGSVNYPNGWARIYVTFIPGTVTTSAVGFGLSTYYDGVSPPMDVPVWGFQVEENVAVPSSYIPTTTVAVTRSFDDCFINTSILPQAANYGTMYARARIIGTTLVPMGGATALAGWLDNNNYVGVYFDSPSTNIPVIEYSKGVNTYRYFEGTRAVLRADEALAFSVNGTLAIGCQNGGSQINGFGATPPAGFPALTDLYIGNFGGPNNGLNGTLSQGLFAPLPSSLSQLQSLTAPKAAPTRLTMAERLMAPELNGWAFDFTDDSCQVKDVATPGNAYNGTATGKFPMVRASTATVMGSDGLYKTVANNEHRFGHNPLSGVRLGSIIGRQVTNSYIWSNDYTQSWWTKTNATAEATTKAAPDGVANCLGLRRAAAGNPATVSRALSRTAAAAGVTTGWFEAGNESIYFSVSGSYFTDTLLREATLSMSNGLPGAWTMNDPGGKIVSKGYQLLKNGWIKVWIVVVPDNTGTFASAIGFGAGSDVSSAHAMWCLMLTNNRSITSDPIPTSGVAATKAIDLVSVSSASLKCGTTQRTAFMAGMLSEIEDDATFNKVFLDLYTATDDRSLNYIALNVTKLSQIGFNIPGGTNLLLQSPSTVVSGVPRKAGYAWNKPSASVGYVNGVAMTLSVDSAAVLDSVTTVTLGSQTAGANNVLSGALISGMVLPRAMIAAELQGITK